VADEPKQGDGKQGPPPDTKGQEVPVVAPRGKRGDVAAGHQAPATSRQTQDVTEWRGHQPPATGGTIDLGHEPPAKVVIVQSAGEGQAPPTTPPAKPADAAQSVTPPPASQESAPPAPSSGDEGE
jgi:hypothetical protein